MKKLICVEDVETLHKEGKQCLAITKQTIITPAAKDLAEEYRIAFDIQVEPDPTAGLMGHELSKDLLVSLLRQLLTDAGADVCSAIPYMFEKHASGLTLIKGSTVTPQALIKSDPNVRYQEFITSAESPFNSGILEMEHSNFYEEKTSDSIYYIIDGQLQLNIAAMTYTATKGDTVFVPKNHEVGWSTPNKVKILCVKLKGVDAE